MINRQTIHVTARLENVPGDLDVRMRLHFNYVAR